MKANPDPKRYFLDYSGEQLTEVTRDKFEQDCHIPGRRITIEDGRVYEWVRAAREKPLQLFNPYREPVRESKSLLGPIPLDCWTL